MPLKRMVLGLLALCLLSSPAARAAEPEQEPAPGIILDWGLKIPLRDGVRLSAVLYRPEHQKEPLPVVVLLTPYGADSGHDRAVSLARHGYIVADVDVRGRGSSGGTFEPMVNEGRDGYDVVEWLARQPWCNGKVTMRGGSYAGYTQWAALKEKPPHLATIVPTAAPYPGVDFPFYKNIFFTYLYQWLNLVSGAANNSKLFADRELWAEKLGELYRSHRPYRELEEVVGNRGTSFRKWLQHPTPDAYWNGMAPTPEQLAVIDVPILTITGAYDGDQPGALAYYRRHLHWAARSAREKHYLVLGPWDHAGTATPAREVGGLTFGAASLVDLEKLHRDWYDWTLKGGPKPDFLKKRVAYYVAGPGAETWKYADTLEEIERERRTYYLGSTGGRANDVFASGRLTKEPQASVPDRYVYDPLDVRPAERESEEQENPLTDQRSVLEFGVDGKEGTGLVYHTDPFPEATEIAGQVKLSLWLSLDVPDTDILAGLFEIRPDGSSLLLASDMLRARYRQSPEIQKLAVPGKIERYDFDGFTWFARRVGKGSRLRLAVTSLNSMFWEKNYNSGGDVAAESARDARTAHVSLMHDAEHASVLEIPLGR